MITILLYLIAILISFKIVKSIIKEYKECNNGIEQTIIAFFLIAYVIPIVIYIIDYFNIPTLIGMSKNIDTQGWLSFLGTYLSTIISILLGSAISIWIMAKQINANYKDNMELNNLNSRIQNLPYLRYEITNEIENIEDFSKTKYILLDDTNYHSLGLSIKVKNIGLNAVRKTYISINSNIFTLDPIELTEQSSIDKNETKKKDFLINSLKEGTYELYITIYFQDLLKNWYEQKIELNIGVTNVYDNNKRMCRNEIKVFDETLLDKEPQFIENN